MRHTLDLARFPAMSPVLPPCYGVRGACYLAPVSDRRGAPDPSGLPPDPAWPGELLGFPQTGSRSVARWGRRILALLVDWFLSLLVVGAVTRTNPWAYTHQGEVNSGIALGLMVLEMWVFTCLLAGSAGQIVLRLAVIRTQGGRLDPGRAFLRTILVMLVIPPLVYNSDQRGLHDLAVDSVVIRR